MNKKTKKETTIEDKRLKTLVIDDEKYNTLLTKKFLARKTWKAIDPSQITSFIPGVIGKIFVNEGDFVEEGGKLLILEAMKMKNIISSPYSGIITKIHVKEGQSVPKGFLLAEIDIKLQKEQ